jgi:uncharacterized membrane protein YbhN (UPF0104 family)
MKIRLAVGLFLSLLFIYLSFWKPDFAGLFSGSTDLYEAFFGHTRIDLAGLGTAMAEAHYEYLIVGVGLLVVSLFFRAQRWRIMLQPVYSEIHYWPVYSAMNIGYMINNILPLRMGEILRAYFLGKAEKISKSSVLATIVVERLLDSVAILVLLSITIFFFPFPDWIRNGLFSMGGGVILLIGFLIMLIINKDFTLNILTKFLRIITPFSIFPAYQLIRMIPVIRLSKDNRFLVKLQCVGDFMSSKNPSQINNKIVSIIDSFSSGLEILRSSRHYLAILMHTVILEACYIASVFVVLIAFDLISPDYPTIYQNPFLASVVLLIIITIGVALPSAPGAVGTFHAIVAFGVSLFGVPAETAMGLAIVLHLANVIPLTLLGIICFWSQQFKLSEVKAQFKHRDISP